MKVSHVLYKVDRLKDGVEKFRHEGFKVDYGSKKNPHNGLIYFSEGPYIELVDSNSISSYVRYGLRLIGKGKVADRFKRWKQVEEGFFGMCLENYSTDFTVEETILKKHGQRYFIAKSSRIDPQDRTLKWKLLFPYELYLPFLMTYFTIDPKPKEFIHPNGVKGISKICFGTEDKLIPIIDELCNDTILELTIGKGVQSVDYVYAKTDS